MPAGGTRRRDDKLAVGQSFQSLMDFVGRKILLQLANEFPKARSSSYRGRERTIEFAVKKELPVLGIETHDIRWQHIDCEIRRELRNIFVFVLRKAVPDASCHEVRPRAATLITTSPDCHSKAHSSDRESAVARTRARVCRRG